MAERKRGKFIAEDLYLDDDTSIEDQISTQISNEAAAGVDYSTDEQDTGQVWIDGTTPVYQKTISIGNLTGGTPKNTAHGITGLLRIVGHEGGMEDGDASNLYPIPFASPSANISVQVQFDATNIQVTAGSFWNRSGNATSLNNVYITVKYLKS